PFGPSNIPRSTSSVSFSSRARTGSSRDPTLALLRSLSGWGNLKTTSHDETPTASWAIKLARSLGSLPPNIRAILNSDGLPQARQVACGLSLTTSHSAHKTAFCSGTALRTRERWPEPPVPERFITEPHQNLRLILLTLTPTS